MLGEVRGQKIVSRFFNNGEIASVDNLCTCGSSGLDEEFEVITQFRGPTRDVHFFGSIFFFPLANAMSSRFLNHFRTPGGGIHMTMPAGLIAFAPNVNLQCLQFSS